MSEGQWISMTVGLLVLIVAAIIAPLLMQADCERQKLRATAAAAAEATR